VSFASSVAAQAAKQKAALMYVRKAALLDLCGKVISRTPVLTGALQGNWQSSIGTPRTGKLNIRPMNMAIAEMVAAVSQLASDGVFYLRNNLDYAWAIEMGHSSKAPAGMLRRTVAEVNRVVRKAMRGVL
jgi:hypothetical protein